MKPVDLDPALRERMTALGVREEDLEENFIRGTGPGGQKINKTASTVQLIHRPSGIEIRCQAGRSQSANRVQARQELCRQLEETKRRREETRVQAREKKRRQTRPRPAAVKREILRGKHERSRVKQLRQKPRGDDG
jgi:protein subunit release factor B